MEKSHDLHVFTISLILVLKKYVSQSGNTWYWPTSVYSGLDNKMGDGLEANVF